MLNLFHHSQFEQHNPLRPLDWRWLRAQALVASRRQFRRGRDDEFTGQAVCYLRDRGRCRTDGQWEKLAQRHPDLHAALCLREGGGLHRWEVEARLLARETSARIGLLTDLTAATVDLYESLFFNVRDRIEAQTFILESTFGRAGAAGGAQDERAVFLQRIGYYGGPLVLDEVLKHRLTILRAPGDPGACPAAEDSFARKIRLLLAVLSPDLDDRTLLRLASHLMIASRADSANDRDALAPEVAETLEIAFEKLSAQWRDATAEPPGVDEAAQFGETA